MRGPNGFDLHSPPILSIARPYKIFLFFRLCSFNFPHIDQKINSNCYIGCLYRNIHIIDLYLTLLRRVPGE